MGRGGFVTPFVGAQLDVCEAFGFAVPEVCLPDYVSRQKCVKRRGRPRKKIVERNY